MSGHYASEDADLPVTMTLAAHYEGIREAQAAAWDQCVASMTYTDGSPVEVALNSNPYRKEPQ